MRYLHTTVRVSDLEESLDFYCNKLGLTEFHRTENARGCFTLDFLCAPADAEFAAERRAPLLELTHNRDPAECTCGRNFGHLACGVTKIYKTCQRLMDGGVMINRPPRDGHIAFVRSPDGISIELLQDGGHLLAAEAWVSMPNTGTR